MKLKINKKGLLLRDFFLFSLIFTIFITGGATMVGLINDGYNVSHSNETEFQNTFGQVEKLTNNSQIIESEMKQLREGSGDSGIISSVLGNLSSFTQIVVKFMSIGWTAIAFLYFVFAEALAILPLPSGFAPVLAGTLMTMLGGYILFIVVSFIWRKDI